MEKYINLKNFRSLMSLPVFKEDIERIWGKQYLKKILKQYPNRIPNKNENLIVKEKIQRAQENISSLLALNLVKFIGVTGSVAAGFAKEEDDIDVFVVVRDGSMWLYRGLVALRNIFQNKVRAKRHRDVRDKLCLNLVCEERDLGFQNDIFNFHELMYMKPIYNEKYVNYIFSQNKWLVEEYGIRKELQETEIQSEGSVNLLLRIFNSIFYYLQLFFMIIRRHNPELERLRKNSKKGRIEFFPNDFKEEKVKHFMAKFE